MDSGVLPGIDVLMRDKRALLVGQRIGLLTNNTGRDRTGASTIDVLHAESSWQLKALFSPEHGIRGEAAAGESVNTSVDSNTGLPVYSLYGDATRPTPAMLNGLDTLVYDIQDVGARVYTYPSTLLEVMRACAEHGLRLVVLDRPNPIGGDQVEGNVLDPKFASFVGAGPIAMRYGLTIGELAHFFNAEMQIGADLGVIPMQGWKRSTWFDQTALEWVNPSPNLRSLSAATVYPGTVLFEGTNLTEGRGTDRPFEWIGAAWIDGRAWASRLNALDLPGVTFSAATRTPSADAAKFAGKQCQGVLISVQDRLAVQPMALGVAMVQTARALAPSRFQFVTSHFDRLAGTDQLRKRIEASTPLAEITASWRPALTAFGSRRERYFLY